MNDMFTLKSIMKEDTKIVAFVGTSKNGTSFIVNHLAQIYANKGINTAILDMTSNRNSFFIYTRNDDNLRSIAENTMDNLNKGTAEGIKVKKNLTVYTSVPDQSNDGIDPESILTTLVKNHSLILIDCDFATDLSYYIGSHELCLVLSMDVLTLQQITKYLYEIKKSVDLDVNRIRIILNKNIRLKSATSESIIMGVSNYNDPRMRYMGPIFDASIVKVNKISFSEEVYVKYLDGLITCNISTSSYPNKIVKEIEELANAIYTNNSKKTFLDPIKFFGNSNN